MQGKVDGRVGGLGEWMGRAVLTASRANGRAVLFRARPRASSSACATSYGVDRDKVNAIDLRESPSSSPKNGNREEATSAPRRPPGGTYAFSRPVTPSAPPFTVTAAVCPKHAMLSCRQRQHRSRWHKRTHFICGARPTFRGGRPFKPPIPPSPVPRPVPPPRQRTYRTVSPQAPRHAPPPARAP